MLSFLVLLDQAAAVAAARGEEILEARALQVVLFANVHALHGHGDPVQTEAAGAAEEEALRDISQIGLKLIYSDCSVRYVQRC